jgi:hypothetical protein
VVRLTRTVLAPHVQPLAKEGAKIVAMLPNAAELYRDQIKRGLDGDPRAALKARVIVRKLFNDEVLIEQDDDGGVWARYSLNPAALIAAGCRNVGAQDALPALYLERIPLRLK